MEVGCLAIVTQDFISELEEELSLFAGDVVQILEVVGKLWFKGESNGVEGKFPRSYARELPLPAAWDPKSHNRLFATLADFPAVQNGDLGFSRGELLIGLENIDDNWCQAENSEGFRGAIPTTHVWEVNTARLPKEEDSKVNRKARVILSMTAQLDDELDLVKDETVTVLRILDRDWYWGEKENGKQGRFPKGFVTLLEEYVTEKENLDQPPSFEECVQTDESPKLAVDTCKEVSTILSTVDQQENNSSTYQNITEVYATTEGYGGANGIQPYARTKYKFSSQYPNELSFDVGQIVHLIRHIDDEWIEGELNNKIGLFPTEYVDIIVDVPHDLPTITGTLAKALYDFESEVTGDLHLKEGEVVIILEKVSDDWYKARNSRGDIGICPVNYVQEIDGVTAPLSPEIPSTVPLGQQHVLSWLASSSPPAAPSVVSSDSGGDPKSVSAPAPPKEKKEKKEKDIKSQTSTPDEEDFSWDFGSPDHGHHKGRATILSPVESEKTQLLPIRPPPPPPAKVIEHQGPQRSAPPVPPSTANSRYENCVNPSDIAAQAAAKELVEQARKEDNKIRKLRELRQCVITEMIQTEKDYNQDLKLCYDIFLKDPSQARRFGIDTVTLFGNLDEVIEVSSQLLQKMEYEQSRPEEEQRIGVCFNELAARLQDIYSHYCRNHDDVSGLLTKYERDPDINRFLQSGVNRMQRNSNCFDLASVLIKPVQRILKYPLLINELEKATDNSHPDKHLLYKTMDEMSKVATDINEIKRRKDLVSKYRTNPEASFSQKLSKLNLHSVKKKSTRLTVKMSSSLGFTTVVRDEEFEKEEHKFELLEKSIKNFLKSMRTFCEQLQECLKVGFQLSEDICDFYADRCNLSEVDLFRAGQHTIFAEHWNEFTRTIERQVVDTLQTVLEMLASPQKIIAKREHKLLDLAACTARMEKNRDATRQKSFEEEEQSARNMYNALNSQLLDELPKLCSLSTDLLRSCVDTFLRARKLLVARITKQLLELADLPGLKTASVNVLDAFEQKHRAALQTFTQFTMIQTNLSGNLFKMESLTKGSNFIRKSFNDKHGTALDLVPQVESQRRWLKQEYGESNVYTIAITIQSSDPNEISLNKGDLVGVVRQSDPSGNPMRWYVDNGRCKGLLASKHLLRDNKNYPTNQQSTDNLGSQIQLKTSKSTTPLRPTSLLSGHSQPLVVTADRPDMQEQIYANEFESLNENRRETPKSSNCENEKVFHSNQTDLAATAKVLPSPFHAASAGIQPSKRVVNPVISNLPNRSNRRQNTAPRSSCNAPSSAAASITLPSSNISRHSSTKPLPALPTEEPNLYSNLDGNICNDNCDTNGQQNPDPRSLIDVRQRVEEYYYALYKLEDVGPGQLPLAQGQVVLVIHTCDLENNPEWWYVEDRYGKQGYVPASYLRKYKTSA